MRSETKAAAAADYLQRRRRRLCGRDIPDSGENIIIKRKIGKHIVPEGVGEGRLNFSKSVV